MFVQTIENRAKKNSSETGLLRKVKTMRDLWSIRIIRPGLLRVGHGRMRAGEEGFRRMIAWPKVGEELRDEAKTSVKFDRS